MAALTAALQKASLRKKDLDLELEELEAAAQMVVEDEEEEGVGESRPICSSGSSSSDESEASEAEGDGCADFSEVGGGEEGGGGETCKDSPLQPRRRSSGAPIPQEPSSTLVSPARTADALPSASPGCRLLIQELGERVARELKLSQHLQDAAEGGSSPPDGGAETGAGRSGGTLLEPSPRRNPLLIVATQDNRDT